VLTNNIFKTIIALIAIYQCNCSYVFIYNWGSGGLLSCCGMQHDRKPVDSSKGDRMPNSQQPLPNSSESISAFEAQFTPSLRHPQSDRTSPPWLRGMNLVTSQNDGTGSSIESSPAYDSAGVDDQVTIEMPRYEEQPVQFISQVENKDLTYARPQPTTDSRVEPSVRRVETPLRPQLFESNQQADRRGQVYSLLLTIHRNATTINQFLGYKEKIRDGLLTGRELADARHAISQGVNRNCSNLYQAAMEFSDIQTEAERNAALQAERISLTRQYESKVNNYEGAKQRNEDQFAEDIALAEQVATSGPSERQRILMSSESLILQQTSKMELELKQLEAAKRSETGKIIAAARIEDAAHKLSQVTEQETVKFDKLDEFGNPTSKVRFSQIRQQAENEARDIRRQYRQKIAQIKLDHETRVAEEQIAADTAASAAEASALIEGPKMMERASAKFEQAKLLTELHYQDGILILREEINVLNAKIDETLLNIFPLRADDARFFAPAGDRGGIKYQAIAPYLSNAVKHLAGLDLREQELPTVQEVTDAYREQRIAPTVLPESVPSTPPAVVAVAAPEAPDKKSMSRRKFLGLAGLVVVAAATTGVKSGLLGGGTPELSTSNSAESAAWGAPESITMWDKDFDRLAADPRAIEPVVIKVGEIPTPVNLINVHRKYLQAMMIITTAGSPKGAGSPVITPDDAAKSLKTLLNLDQNAAGRELCYNNILIAARFGNQIIGNLLKNDPTMLVGYDNTNGTLASDIAGKLFEKWNPTVDWSTTKDSNMLLMRRNYQLICQYWGFKDYSVLNTQLANDPGTKTLFDSAAEEGKAAGLLA
jgi:hypothetical protein